MGLRGWARIELIGLALLVAAGAGCQSSPPANDGTVDVVASFYPLAELAQRVGGPEVRVTNLTAAGVEPHDLELTSRQVDKLEDADLLLYLGRGFQPAVADIARRREGPTLDLLQHVDLATSAKDPHFWLDPVRMSEAAGAVAGALAKVAPTRATAIRANAGRYQAELTGLNQQLAKGLAVCQRHTIVTAHDAFGYLAARYGLSQRAIAGLSPEAEPDAGRLGHLADEVKAGGVTTVFFEELTSPAVAKALARETGARTAVLNPMEGLTKKEAAAGKDYTAVMRDNLDALRKALACR